jgi:hypothetical protein
MTGPFAGETNQPPDFETNEGSRQYSRELDQPIVFMFERAE